jgi:hypothetical protein
MELDFCMFRIKYSMDSYIVISDSGGSRDSPCRRALSVWYVHAGCVRVDINLISYHFRLVLVDFPATATFLTLEERAYIVWKKSECFYFDVKIPSKPILNHLDRNVFQSTTTHPLENKRISL